MTTSKRVVVGLCAAIMALAATTPALAGGSWLEPTFVRVEPGETLTLSGPVSVGQLGWVKDGPFYAYLSGESIAVITSVMGGAETDVLLGEIAMEPIDSSNMQLTVEVTIPDDTAPGEYWVTHCNNPCTSGFGDLFGSQLYVGMDPPTDDAVETTTTVAPTTTVPQQQSGTDSSGATTATVTSTTDDTAVVAIGEASGPTNGGLGSEPPPKGAGPTAPVLAVIAMLVVGVGLFVTFRLRRSA